MLAAICVALMLLGDRGGLGTKAAVFGATAGMLYGVSATLMKPVVEAWHADGLGDVLAGWQFWVMAAAGLVGFYLQQVSLATGRLVTSVATVSVVNPIVSVLLGAFVLQERLDKTPEWHASRRSAHSPRRCSARSSSPRRRSTSRTRELAVS